MVKKRKTGKLKGIAATLLLAALLSGCVVSKETYQNEYNRAADCEAKAEDLEARLREKAESERRLERKALDAEARAADAEKKTKAAQLQAEEAKGSLETCRKEKTGVSADVDAVRKSLRAAEDQAAQLKEKLKAAEEKQRESKAASETQLGRQSANIEQMRSRIADLTAERDVLTEKLAKLAAEKKTKVEEVSKSYDTLIGSMKDEIAQGQVIISQLKGQLSVKLQDEILFQSGSADIKADGKKLLSTLAKALAGEPGKAIQIEGHTDSVKIGGALAEKYQSNWELSSARAVAVVRYLSEKEGLDGRRLSAAGFGEFNPIADNSTNEGKAKNRRIEIKLLPLEPQAEEVKSSPQEPQGIEAQPNATPAPAGDAPKADGKESVPPPNTGVPPGEPRTPADQPEANKP